MKVIKESVECRNQASDKATLVEEEIGATLVEYALLASLIAVVCVASVKFVGEAASDIFTEVGKAIAQDTEDGGGEDEDSDDEE